MSEQNLYEKLGGKEGIAKVVDYFYTDLVLEDEEINQFFEHTDMDKQREHQTKFLSFAVGGPNQYSGASMAKAHAGMNIQPENFESIAKHLNEALAHFGVSEEDRNHVLNKINTLKDDIVYK
ncbi:group 1 truncated hemoglobin [Bacillus sp. HMF5848]|uniref:group I truncated hemoglobin n=1 Tax=Bacillus sp. HMF5848 TaxID=2495421 RepID=UPI000F7AB27B|nr:group 1 truncated hemoglobin [Bacillus sp. HMF5848]RSK28923.1 group 1 truncated hemoglobin [Bacillus sp. HMF5848]